MAAADGYTRPVLHDLFLTRYSSAYLNEISAFILAVGGKSSDMPTGIGGLNALLIADAALEPAKSEQLIEIDSRYRS